MNPVPLNLMVKLVFWTDPFDGLAPLNVGCGLFTLNVPAVADPPPGAGLTTPMRKSPARIKKLSGMVPLNAVSETKRVEIGVPSTVIRDVSLKFVPATEIETAGDPASAEFGVTEEAVGTGLSTFTENAAVPRPAPETKPFNVRGWAV